MGFGVNLRFDLKPLGEAQLTALLESSWQCYEAAKEEAEPYILHYSARGLIRHPCAYPFVSMLSYGWPRLWNLGPAFFYSIWGLISSRERAVMHMHLALCEIADITDEIQRRISQNSRAE